MSEVSTPVVSASILVAALAVIALGSRPAPRPAPSRPSTTAIVAAPDSPPVISPSAPLDLSRASAAEIEALPRVGPALAARIVAARTASGLRSVDDLDAVRGIGPALLERLRPLVTFGDQNRSMTNPQRNPSESVSRPAPPGSPAP